MCCSYSQRHRLLFLIYTAQHQQGIYHLSMLCIQGISRSFLLSQTPFRRFFSFTVYNYILRRRWKAAYPSRFVFSFPWLEIRAKDSAFYALLFHQLSSSQMSTMWRQKSFGILDLSILPLSPCVPVFAPLGAGTWHGSPLWHGGLKRGFGWFVQMSVGFIRVSPYWQYVIV